MGHEGLWSARKGGEGEGRGPRKRERKNAVGPSAGASRGTSFRVHDGVDALEARRACGGSFSSRSYVDRKTLRVATSSSCAPSSRREREDREGAHATPRCPGPGVPVFFAFISFSNVP